MAGITVHGTDDPVAALAAAGDYLLTEPVRHSIFLTLLVERAPGRYWWAETGPGATVSGFAMQTPSGFSGGVTPAAPAVVDALCDRMLDDVPDLPGVIAEAAVASRFAGRWADRTAVPARPTETQRVYELTSVILRPDANGSGGTLRQGGPADRDVLVEWAAGFLADVGDLPAADPAEVVDRHLAAGRLWVWVDGGPVAMATATAPLGGVSRIGSVYTPTERRRRGYASALVAALSQRLLDGGADRCMLYAQLHNPTSNAIYRRMGYRPVAEILFYQFG